jgi:hypothetical protein
MLLATCAAVLVGAPSAFADTHTQTFDYPVSMDPFEVKQDLTYGIETPKVDGFITAMSVNVVDPDGSPVPINRLMLHHIVFAKIGPKNPACGSYTAFDSKTQLPALAEPFYGNGEERNVLVLPPGYGYPVAKGDVWTMAWMLMNHRPKADAALIRYTVTWEDADAPLKPVLPIWLDVENCRADPVYDVPGSGKPAVHERRYEVPAPASGRIVAAGGHVHGGAKDLILSQPECGNREIFRSTPAWGTSDHQFYKVRPILHEPGPISMSGMLSTEGFPVRQGDRIRLTSRYDNTRPHTRVMGISVVYLAPGEVTERCGPPPSDLQVIQPADLAGTPYRTRTPAFTVPLTGVGPNGRAVSISRPPGATTALADGSTLGVRNYSLGRPNVRVAKGSRLNWRFNSATLHNVTLANGPRGFSSPNLNDGRKFGFKFKVPGTYRMFCGLHPVSMTQTVTVR